MLPPATSRSIGRRDLLGMAVWMNSAATRPLLLYWGTYTEGGGQFGNGTSKGIYVSRMETETGRITEPELAVECANPSWLAIHPNGRYLYAVNERMGLAGKVDPGEVSAFSIDRKSGKLTEINRVPSQGGQPCHVSVDKTGKMAVVANWYTGSAAAFPIRRGGVLGEAATVCRQEGGQTSHCHSVTITPDNRFLLSTNTGLNKVFVYRLDAEKAKLVAHDPPFLGLQKPTNPRHLSLHPNGRWAYVSNEINPGGCTMLRYDKMRGVLEEGPVAASVPPDYTGRVSPAECIVHPSGRFVYESNRGHNSIAVFGVNPDDGSLAMIETFLPGGEGPRSFTIDPSGRFLIVMMQRSNSIVRLRIDPQSGKLSSNGDTLALPTPVCALFAGLR